MTKQATMRTILIFVAIARGSAFAHDQDEFSHPPLRSLEWTSSRPLGDGPAYFVSPAGNDENAGTVDAPWKTVARALRQLKAGQTLYLRDGVYRENVYLALAGRRDQPITIGGYPGEQATIDGSFREFFETPATAWEPVQGAAAGEYRSTRRYPNLRNVVGSFGDSMIGLQTYYHGKDLRATSETVDWEDWDRRDQTDLKPLYCGPGMWYDRSTGHIHSRLAHTSLPPPINNYAGPTDPRKVPLLVASYQSVPLLVDRAEHIRFQDLTIRGAGYTSVILDQAVNVTFDNVTVWCGTYGMRVSGTRGLRFIRSALYGNVAPWTFRGDGSKRDYPGRPHRNLSRLNTHALLEIESGRESSVYATPQNDDWEIAYSEFTDAHDALYLGAINGRFHHNLIEGMQDDGIYLSPMYLRHRLDKKDPRIRIDHNVFRGVLTALAFGGSEPDTRDQFFICRNFFDLRHRVNTGRPTAQRPEPGFSTGKLMGDHGSPPWPAMNIYHNTVVTLGPNRDAAMGAAGHTRAGNQRRVFNNVFYHFGRFPGFMAPNAEQNSAADANLYWSPQQGVPEAEKLFARFRSSEGYEQSKKIHPPGSTTHSIVADPQFQAASPNAVDVFDYRLMKGSPAIGRGIKLPADWPDALRASGAGNPDLGALPFGTSLIQVGRRAEAPN